MTMDDPWAGSPEESSPAFPSPHQSHIPESGPESVRPLRGFYYTFTLAEGKKDSSNPTSPTPKESRGPRPIAPKRTYTQAFPPEPRVGPDEPLRTDTIPGTVPLLGSLSDLPGSFFNNYVPYEYGGPTLPKQNAFVETLEGLYTIPDDD